MTKLNDLESILLSAATQRESGSLFPAPETVAKAATRLTKAIGTLMKRGFVEERETGDKASTQRTDGDFAFGVFITEAGNAAIGLGDAGEGDSRTPPIVTAKPPRTTKTTAVLNLLKREIGATMPELIAATGWLPHTTRAALTGIRKKGHNVQRIKRGDETCYRVVTAAAQ